MTAEDIEANTGMEAMDEAAPALPREAAAFDYSAMDQATADEARAMVARVRERAKSYYMDTGRELMSMKDRLDHGLFQRWVEAEMGMTARTAQNMMQAASQLGHKSETVSHLPAGVLYKLAAPSTPAPVRDEIVGRLEAGEVLTAKAIDSRLWEARAAAKSASADAKLTPDERKRQSQTKKAAEARRQREHQKHHAEVAQRAAERKSAANELAAILVRFLDHDAYDRAYTLFSTVNSYEMREALADARHAAGHVSSGYAEPSGLVDV